MAEIHAASAAAEPQPPMADVPTEPAAAADAPAEQEATTPADGVPEPEPQPDDELSAVKALLPAGAVKTATQDMLAVALGHSDATKCTLRVHFHTGYPNEQPPVVEVASKVMPRPLVLKLTKLGSDAAGSAVEAGAPAAAAVVSAVADFIDTNLFVSCWREVRQIKQLVDNVGGAMDCDPSDGTLRLRVGTGRYRARITARVFKDYPSGGIELNLEKHNFHAQIGDMFLNQGRELVRRCTLGYSADIALKASNPIEAPPPSKGPQMPRVRMTSEHVQGLKNDVAYFKKASDLREVNTKRNSRNNNQFTHSTQTRKDARKELRHLNKAEQQRDAAQEEKMADIERAERLALQSQPKDDSEPSLLAAVTFLVSFATKLPDEPCQACGKRVLPEDPTSSQATTPAAKRKPSRPPPYLAPVGLVRRLSSFWRACFRCFRCPCPCVLCSSFPAVRVFCGHWFHFECLDHWLRNPPFIWSCPVCERRIYHPHWPADVSVLERAWANEQATAREIDDVKDFLDGGSGGGGGGGGGGGEDFSAFC